MDIVAKLISQLKAVWDRWSASQRVGILVALLVSVAAIVGVARWATTPEYVLLTDRLSPQKSAETVSVLEAAKISYQLNYSGSAVSVPRNDVSRARLALKDVIAVSPDEKEELSEGIWTDPTLHQARLTRNLENRLARSISQLTPVRSATVLLTQADANRFVRAQSPAKASVILELQPGAMFSAADARAVISLVAHSVEHLDPANVSVLDTSGRLLSGASGVDTDVAGQLSYRSRVEAELSSKAETILTQMLGPGKAVVRVTADVDFTDLKRTETRYDPDSKVKLTETIHSESHSGASRNPAGPAGAGSNMDALAFKASGSGGTTRIESTETKYENARTENTVHQTPGRINRLTVAAVVQLPEVDQAAQATAAAAVTSEQIERIVKQAVGFDASRGDAIEVLKTTLAGNPELPASPGTETVWERYEPLLRVASLGLASIVALILGFLVIRRMRPIVVETETKESLPAEVVLRLASLSQQARNNPAAAASVINAWLDQPSEQKSQKKSAA